MNELIRDRILFFSLAAILSVVSVSEANGQNVIGDILRRMENHNKGLATVQANVTMRKYNPQLDTTDTYTGSTSYIPKTNPKAKGKLYIRLDWVKPAIEQISIIGDDYKLYKPSIKTVYAGRVDKAKTSAAAGNALGFMSMSRDQLRANYDIQFVAQENIEGGIPTWRLLLNPKVPSSYKHAELWVDGNGMPVQAKITEQNNDTTTVLLSNIRKNETIDVKIFVLNTKGAKVIPA